MSLYYTSQKTQSSAPQFPIFHELIYAAHITCRYFYLFHQMNKTPCILTVTPKLHIKQIPVHRTILHIKNCAHFLHNISFYNHILTQTPCNKHIMLKQFTVHFNLHSAIPSTVIACPVDDTIC